MLEVVTLLYEKIYIFYVLYYFVIDVMNGGVNGKRIAFYVVGALICLACIFIVTWFQYNATYLATYVESGVRRITLAEQLRKIPLFFMFLLVASRLYAPLEGALQNLAAVISTKTNINRMNEILDHPIQTGSSDLSNKGYDIVFDHVGFSYNTGETVLKDVSFTAKQGEVTALVGPSGGGKAGKL